MHYDRARVHGDPGHADSRTGRSIDERFWALVERLDDDARWLWRGYIQPNGYGKFHPTGSDGTVYAHRFAYEMLVGSIAVELELGSHVLGPSVRESSSS